MAVATAAGMFSSMMLTLLVVPVFYLVLDDLVAGARRRLRRLVGRGPTLPHGVLQSGRTGSGTGSPTT
jgi:hypothetical protein